MELLPNINSHDDLVRMSEQDKVRLCAEIREFLVSAVSRTGGHLAGNLGTVELSVALETVYDTRVDRLIFDVGHQSYTHKILTGRRDAFRTLRSYGGISGFPKPEESIADAFVAGHASNSISIALGMARARTICGENYHVAAVIGDGAYTGGMAFEGINDAAESKEPLVIILNDNEMSIARNVGGLARHLSKLRASSGYQNTKAWYRRTLKRIPGGIALYNMTRRMKNRLKRLLVQTTVFENLGLEYLGPVDGHDLSALISVLQVAQNMQTPVLVHVVTQKGRGYAPAEADPARFHGIGKFDPRTGESLEKPVRTFSVSFGEKLTELAETNGKICAITAAMPAGTGLAPFAAKYPTRFFDVGIAEEHAISMAGGMAKQGVVPVAAIYSTFLQRAFDQIVQDVALMHLHVVLAIDRAGLVGDDGPTHHGVFDVGLLCGIPGMLMLAPASLREQADMLEWAIGCYDGPIALRYPRGGEGNYSDSAWLPAAPLSSQKRVVSHIFGEDITLITYGVYTNEVMRAASVLAQAGIRASVLRLTLLSDPDVETICRLAETSKPFVVVEEAVAGYGVYEKLSALLHSRLPSCRVYGINIGRDFVPQGDRASLYDLCGLSAAAVAEFAKEVLDGEK